MAPQQFSTALLFASLFLAGGCSKEQTVAGESACADSQRCDEVTYINDATGLPAGKNTAEELAIQVLPNGQYVVKGENFDQITPTIIANHLPAINADTSVTVSLGKGLDDVYLQPIMAVLAEIGVTNLTVINE